MEEPKDKIDNWKTLVEKETEENILSVIKLDLEEELEYFEDVVREYESLIEKVEEKLEKLSSKHSNASKTGETNK